jgi:hypothetical protein
MKGADERPHLAVRQSRAVRCAATPLGAVAADADIEHITHCRPHKRFALLGNPGDCRTRVFSFTQYSDFIYKSYFTIHKSLPSRQTFFEHLRALIQYLPFDNWDHLMRFIIQRLDHDPSDSG